MKVKTKDLINMKEIEKEALIKLTNIASAEIKLRLIKKLEEGKEGWDSEEDSTIDEELIESIAVNLKSVSNNVNSLRAKSTGEYQDDVLDIICAAILLWNRA